MKNLESLFKQLGITIKPSYNLYIKDVQVDVLLSQWTINIYSNKLIELDYYLEILNKFSDFFKNKIKNIVIHLTLEQKKLLEQDVRIIKDYYDYIIKNNRLLNSAFKNTSMNIYDNKFVFDIKSIQEKKMLVRNIDVLQLIINNLGIENFEIEFNDIEDNYTLELEKEIKKREDEFFNKNEFNDVKSTKVAIFGDNIQENKVLPIEQVLDENNMLINCAIEGEIFELELRKTTKTHLLIIMIADKTGTITAKAFPGWNNQPPTIADLEIFKIGMIVRISGRKEYDRYSKEETIMISSASIIDAKPKISLRVDEYEQKRVELHMHTKMSKNNGINTLEEYAKLAKHFGHQAIAITDHDVVQGYVDAEKITKNTGVKIIHGIEATVVKDTEIVFNVNNQLIKNSKYIVFDLETTGLSANFNKIIEIGAVKLENNLIIERFQRFIKIDEHVSDFITGLTGITDDDLNTGDDLKKVLKDFYNWSKDGVLVAHNALFDMQFLARNYEAELGISLNQPVLDTLELSRFINYENTYHSLKILAKKYQVPLDSTSHHRADYDAEKLTEIFVQMLEEINDMQINTFQDLNETNDINKTRGFHNLIYVKNQSGLRDMYELVSDANTVDLQFEPRILKSKLNRLRDNLIYIGGGCAKSEIVDSYLNHSSKMFEKTILQFDFVEIMPISNYITLITSGIFQKKQQLIIMQKKIIEVCLKNNIKIIATGNVHYTEPKLAIIKEILHGKDYKPAKIKKNKLGIVEEIDKIKFKKWIQDNKIKNTNQFYKTTEEMFEEFSYLDKDISQEIIVTNPNLIVDMCDTLKIIPDKLYTPNVDGVDDKLIKMVYQKAHDIYGEVLPKIVNDRLEKETKSIIKYGFSIVYYISAKLVKHSLDNGYLVGSRGSVGSSLVATFMDITEINPLSPHYICPNCKDSEFFIHGEVASGFDLDKKNCSTCNIEMIRDGQDIPFETFLGFEGDKVPDIDLNFSGEFQAEAHNYVRSKKEQNDDDLFDVNHAFKAGTTGTIAEKTAYAYVKNYFDLLDENVKRTDISYYLRYCVGIKRTTGQHPGGIIVVPENLEIYDFTPIQYPANDKKQPWRTTHFDFHSIHDNLLKLDILGHDDPTMLKKLKDSTNIDPKYIDIADDKILELFSSTKSLNFIEEVDFKIGTLGVPEFGTPFVQEMLLDTVPTTFAELVQISGLSHGTDVWLGNAKNLIDNNTCVLKDVIGCRDDIMIYLLQKDLEPLLAFSIMENVRKGKGLSVEEIKIMKNKNVPDWYIDSCQKIKYMFPKAHASAYVLMALRIAYYKVNYPLDYYASYFGSRIDDFEAQAMIKGLDTLKERINLIENFTDDSMSDVKKKSILNSLKMSLEMIARGYKFLPFDLNKSDSFIFVIDREQQGLIMPFSTIEGLGEKEAIRIIEERKIAPFTTIEDFKKRTRVKKKSFETLDFYNVFEGLEENSQLTLF